MTAAEPVDPRVRPARWSRRVGRRWPATLAVGLLAVVAAGWALLRPEPGPIAFELTGDLRTHDPALVVGRDGEPWSVFSTGDEREAAGAIQVRTSPDGRAWTSAGTVWTAETAPAWVEERVPGVKNYWAPEVVEHDGTGTCTGPPRPSAAMSP